MTKLSNIISHIVYCDDFSGKFSSCPIDIKELARNSDDSVPKEADDETNGYENIPTGSENVPSDSENFPTEVENVPSDTGNVPTEFENVPSDPEKVVNDAKNAPTDVEIGDRNPEIATKSAEGTVTGGDDVAKSADSTTGNDVKLPPSPDGSVAILQDTSIPSESRDTSIGRIKNKAKKIRSFFKKKSRKDERKERYLESPV